MANGWGGARPGAGRKPRTAEASAGAGAADPASNVIPFEARRPTLGEALNALRPAAPASQPAPIPGATPAPAPPAGATPPPLFEPPPENQMFAEMVGFVAPSLAVIAFTKSIEHDGKLRCREPDGEAMEKASDITTRSVARALGNAEVPWWAGLALAYGNLYLAMRMGAEKVDIPPETKQAGLDAAAATAASSAAGPLGQAPVRRPPAPPPPGPRVGLSKLPTISPTAL